VRISLSQEFEYFHFPGYEGNNLRKVKYTASTFRIKAHNRVSSFPRRGSEMQTHTKGTNNIWTCLLLTGVYPDERRLCLQSHVSRTTCLHVEGTRRHERYFFFLNVNVTPYFFSSTSQLPSPPSANFLSIMGVGSRPLVPKFSERMSIYPLNRIQVF
jgi:hypothetical protein